MSDNPLDPVSDDPTTEGPADGGADTSAEGTVAPDGGATAAPTAARTAAPAPRVPPTAEPTRHPRRRRGRWGGSGPEQLDLMTAGTTSRVPTQQRGHSALAATRARRRRRSSPADTWARAPLLTRAADLPGGLLELFSEDAVDELVSRRGLRAPFLRVAQRRPDPRRPRVHQGGGVGRHRRRPGERRQAAAPLRRRRDDRAPGPAPHLGPAHRLHAAAGRGARPPGAGQRLRHPEPEHRLQRPLRRARRLRAPDGRREALAVRPARARAPLRDEPWTDHRAAVRRPGAASRTTSSPSAPATSSTSPAGGSTRRPRWAASAPT